MMELVDMRDLKSRPPRVLVRPQVRVIFLCILLTHISDKSSSNFLGLINLLNFPQYCVIIDAWALHLAFVLLIVFILLNDLFFLTPSIIWGFSYFSMYFYLIIIVSIALYSLSVVKDAVHSNKFSKNSSFNYLTGLDLSSLFTSFLLVAFLINLLWTHQSVTVWFGNLFFTAFQSKLIFLVLFFFYLYLISSLSAIYISSRETYEYYITCFNFFIWILLLFCANSVFTVIFFIEILSTLILLLLISGAFSTTYYYNNLNLNMFNYFSLNTPLFFFQSVLYFFWISLISSLNLFLFLILFYLKFLTYDWFLIEFIFFFYITTNSFKDLFVLIFVWLNFLFCIFLKCGLVPFYFWKPIFFKGLPLHVLFFYVSFFYFFIFLFFCFFLLNYLNQIFFFFIAVNVFFLFTGIILLLFILNEAYYLKSFIALSSILNSLFVFLTLNGTNFFFFMI